MPKIHTLSKALIGVFSLKAVFLGFLGMDAHDRDERNRRFGN